MTEQELIKLINFCFDRFYGQTVTDQILRNCIRDYRAQQDLLT